MLTTTGLLVVLSVHVSIQDKNLQIREKCIQINEQEKWNNLHGIVQ
jgi:hypothetical protein